MNDQEKAGGHELPSINEMQFQKKEFTTEVLPGLKAEAPRPTEGELLDEEKGLDSCRRTYDANATPNKFSSRHIMTRDERSPDNEERGSGTTKGDPSDTASEDNTHEKVN